MNTWKCLIVDDEDVDRLMVMSFVKRFPELEIAGACKTVSEALAILEKSQVDILFLDVDMPDENGLELRRKASAVPACVFVSGHAEHAAESFDLDTLDFVVKPVKFDRFEKAVARIRAYLSTREKAQLFDMHFGADSITIREGHDQVKINLGDIICLEALKDYTLLVTARKKYCVWSNLGTLLKQPQFETFVRIHKSHAVRPQFVSRITAHEVELNGRVRVPVGRAFKENVKNML